MEFTLRALAPRRHVLGRGLDRALVRRNVRSTYTRFLLYVRTVFDPPRRVNLKHALYSDRCISCAAIAYEVRRYLGNSRPQITRHRTRVDTR